MAITGRRKRAAAPEGIAGPWTRPEAGPADTEPDQNKEMRRWEARARAYVLDFELLSSLKFQASGDAANATGKVFVNGSDKLVELMRPSAECIRKNQLDHVVAYADLRRDREAEILSQINDLETFFGSVCPLHPERNR